MLKRALATWHRHILESRTFKLTEMLKKMGALMMQKKHLEARIKQLSRGATGFAPTSGVASGGIHHLDLKRCKREIAENKFEREEVLIILLSSDEP